MNVSIENLAPCRKLLRIEIDAEAVTAAFDAMVNEFRKEANLPGFRPGKAPRDMVAKRYEKEIADEVRRKLLSENYRKAVEEQKLDVLGVPDIEEIQFGRGQAMLFAATVETAPEIQLPEYKGLPAKREIRSVTDEDVARALDVLREQRATFETAARAAATGDIVVVNYTGTCEGKPIGEIAPVAKSLGEAKAFWIGIEARSFLPGFAEQLIGTQAGDRRTVTIDFPADFRTTELAGKRGEFAVEVVEVKERVLPPLDEALAKALGADSLDKLREGVRKDLENELKYKLDRQVRTQIIRELLSRVQFELPESAVATETRNVVYDIVNENARRGVGREMIERDKEAIYAAAANSAKERVKIAFLVQKIAEQEDIKVSNEEIARRATTLAAMYQIPPDKFVKDLQKRNGLVEIYDQLAHEKVMEFLQQHAQIEEVPSSQMPMGLATANPS
ncbi:MAG TPA: trigger factor [Verrucomicrobiae bacterium]